MVQLDFRNLKDVETKAKREANAAEEGRLREEEQKLLGEIAKSPQEATLARYFHGLELVTEAFVKSDVHALVVHGSAGLSKSYTVFRTLAKHAGETAIVPVVGHITPLAMFKLLYDHRDKIIVLDDLDSKSLRSDLFMAMLKAASWSATGSRLVSWHSNSKVLADEEIPPSFEFKGKIVLLANSLPDNDEFDAFLNRALVKEVRVGFEDLRKLFDGLASLPFGKTTEEQRQAVVAEVFSLVRASTESLSLRTYVKAMELFSWDALRWKEAFKETLQEDADLKAYYAACSEFETAGEQARSFIERTGKSRATFYRLRNRLSQSLTN